MTYNLCYPRKLTNFISLQRSAVYFGVFIRAMSTDAEMSSTTWRGVPLCEIIGSQSPWGAPEFPLVAPSRKHAVLYHVPSSGGVADRPLKPQIGEDKWDSEHVRMPYSSKSLYPVEDSNGETHLKKRWTMIEDALRKPILNSKQLADTIISYNTKFKNIWKFKALHTLFNDHLDEEESNYFFTVTLPAIAKLALDLPKLVQAPIPLLKQHSNRSISLSQHQVASLLANAFFCTFPRRNTFKRSSEYESYPHINFSALYEVQPYDDVLEKLKCLCHYFRRVCTNTPVGAVTFSRRSCPARGRAMWARSRSQLCELPLHVDSAAMIEDAHGLIQLDFANKYLGGGVLGRGSVQEEIRFSICPELMISMLFTEVLKPNEALIMIGCERYSAYSGYGHTFRWAGDHRESSPRDASARRRVAVLAIDALPYGGASDEFRLENFTRELNKAWIGFTFFSDGQSSLQYPGIATGNWGCGAFGGTPQLKSIIQLMACAEARRPIAYFTFGDTEIRDDIIRMYNLLSRFNVSVGQLYEYLVRYSESYVRNMQLNEYLEQVILEENKSSSPPKGGNMCTSLPEMGQTSDKQNKLNNSPDLFSQDEEESLSMVTNKVKTTPNPCKIPKIAHESNKVCNEEKVAAHTTRLFEELSSFDNESGNLNLTSNKDSTSLTSKYFDKEKTNDSKNVDNKMADRVDKMATCNSSLAKEGVKSASGRKSLFEEMQKFDEEHGRLNLSTPHTLLLSESKIAIPDSDASMDSDGVQASPEVRKKIAKKITDYFSKRST